LEQEDVLCIADREHRRIVCVNAGLKHPESFGDIISVTNGVEIGRIFAIVYGSKFIRLYFQTRCKQK